MIRLGRFVGPWPIKRLESPTAHVVSSGSMHLVHIHDNVCQTSPKYVAVVLLDGLSSGEHRTFSHLDRVGRKYRSNGCDVLPVERIVVTFNQSCDLLARIPWTTTGAHFFLGDGWRDKAGYETSKGQKAQIYRFPPFAFVGQSAESYLANER